MLNFSEEKLAPSRNMRDAKTQTGVSDRQRIRNSLVAFSGLSLRRITTLVGLLALCWLGSDAALVQSQFAAAQGPAAEQSFDIPSAWAHELTAQQGWGAEHPRMLADVNGDKRQDVVGFGDGGVWLATSNSSSFTPAYVLADFGYQSGWRVAQHVRTTADINGDKLDDIVGFGNAGVYRALSTASGFGPATYVIANFGYDQGWRVDRHVRLLADVNGDGRKDIVAFGDAGVWLSLATSSGYFSAPAFVVAEFGFNQGWTPALHPRLTADINGDGRQDIVGFANDGVWTALSTGNGFSPAQGVLGEFGYLSGGWRVDRHPRLLADINGDGKQDIVGFGDAGVYRALSTGSGFAAAQFVLAEFGYNQGWRVGKHPRFVTDLNGDGYQDIVGFGDESVYRALGGPTGFGSMRGVLRDLVADRFPFNLDDVDQLAPRFVGDVNGDGKHDLVAFDATEIKVARSSDLAPPPVPLNVRITGETTSAFTLAGSIGVDPATLPEVQRAPKPPCSAQKTAEVLALVRDHRATPSAPSVKIDCSLTLRPNDVITNRLVFKGASASGVTVECNGATIDGGPGTPNYNPSYAVNMVEISSEEIDPDPVTGDRRWSPPVGITLRNCKIKGSVWVYGMTGVETTEDNYVTRARNNAPRSIVFDNVTITGQGLPCAPSSTDCTPLYLHAGVNNFQMLNSTINGKIDRKAVGIYLDDVTTRNTFRNNRIEPDTDGREVMSLDGSSYNTIINNFFSGLDHGGIYLYSNCGEEGSERRGRPTHNTIINNVFYYDRYDGDNPSIFVASRNGNSRYCTGVYFDDAKFNVVMQNQIFKLPVSDVILRNPITGLPFIRRGMIRVGHPEVNTPNYIAYNETVTAEIERKAGCYIRGGYPDFLRDGQSTNVFHNANGDPVCTGYRLTCDDGVLRKSSDSTCQVSQVSSKDFECQASGNNSGCQKTVSVPPGKNIIGAKAACNLEFGTVSATDLDGVIPNFVKVLRASDNVSQGSCTLGSTSIRSLQDVVSGVNGLNSVSFGCRENDSNGGDCHIKVRLYYK
jgi:hypothetical protein